MTIMCIDIDLLFNGGPVVCKLSPNEVHTDLLFNGGPVVCFRAVIMATHVILNIVHKRLCIFVNKC